MQATAQSRGGESRRELLDVAIDCFARFGYQATSIDRIAREAGVTKGALYYHFKDKGELLFEAVKSRVGQWENRVVGEVRAVTSAAERLRQVAQVCLDHATKSNHRRMIITLMVEALDTNAPLSAEFRAMMQRFRTFLRTLVQSGQRHGEFRPNVDAAVAAEVYAGAVMGAEIQYYQDTKAISLQATLDAFIEQYLGWLAADSHSNHNHRRTRAAAPAKPRGRRS
ncbi:MAG: TetR/AcrR family transcriptional regulator [Deltaproteobacteria bacterium]|nr:TetR/AcrR family transcriptional regulator [Deltaproteobacteria bacterium]MBI3391168.1 TetR/AcrR family transcriptional regulator [Deltaproteobacteria bacterium]